MPSRPVRANDGNTTIWPNWKSITKKDTSTIPVGQARGNHGRAAGRLPGGGDDRFRIARIPRPSSRRPDSNDQWQYYQASRLKFHNLELGERLIGVLGPNNRGREREPGAIRQREAEVHRAGQGSAGEGHRQDGRVGSRRAPRAALRSGRRSAGDRAGAEFALFHRAQDAVSGGRRHRRHRRV